MKLTPNLSRRTSKGAKIDRMEFKDDPEPRSSRFRISERIKSSRCNESRSSLLLPHNPVKKGPLNSDSRDGDYENEQRGKAAKSRAQRKEKYTAVTLTQPAGKVVTKTTSPNNVPGRNSSTARSRAQPKEENGTIAILAQFVEKYLPRPPELHGQLMFVAAILLLRRSKARPKEENGTAVTPVQPVEKVDSYQYQPNSIANVRGRSPPAKSDQRKLVLPSRPPELHRQPTFVAAVLIATTRFGERSLQSWKDFQQFCCYNGLKKSGQRLDTLRKPLARRWLLLGGISCGGCPLHRAGGVFFSKTGTPASDNHCTIRTSSILERGAPYLTHADHSYQNLKSISIPQIDRP
ncbi:uncharacterized protein LY89DRAFT_747744 [Mollisia scopiformis]|uniref:Uncharacterized protein n=1 Tax=Mollisia scopiformis TaxID=149040 RepID=A0A194XCD7_MOLSC|nr:uncharacterized protein LY89DRAFT_747744 [Mollisia scopiformis]KUJ17838.1 hypothetical protein LY89DRAFT_747744 [Mollisia scopiformis]